MEEIAMIGFGEQGIKAVAGTAVQRELARKILIDNDRALLEQYSLAGQCLYVDFCCDMGLWDPGYRIKQWLEDEENQKLVFQYIEGVSMLIFVTGLGGTMSLAAKELADFLSKERPDTAIYFMCSLPFRHETDYKHNYLSRILLDFLRCGKVGWTVIENDKIQQIYGGNWSKAYDISFEYMAYLLDCIFCLRGPGIWNSKIEFSELRNVLRKGLIHISIWEGEGELPENSLTLENELLPYLPSGDCRRVLMALEIASGVRLPGMLKNIDRILDQKFTTDCSCSCRMCYGHASLYTYRVILVSSGAESGERSISIREICPQMI